MADLGSQTDSSHGETLEYKDVKKEIERLHAEIAAEKQAIAKYKQYKIDHDVVE